MAYEQNFQEATPQFEPSGDVSLKPNWKLSPASENVTGCFDCNICLDSAHDPVVTLCGHLYCWPCIYKWLHVQSSSFESNEETKCPVCKANISESSLIPLYGRGTCPSETNARRTQLGMSIPRRPAALGVHTMVTAAASMTHTDQQLQTNNPFQLQPQPFHHQQYFPHPYGDYPSMASSNLVGTTMTSIFSVATMFGSSDTSLFAYPYSNAYPLVGNGSPRTRRQDMQVDKSLNRVSVFLFCCFILCLLLF